MGEGGLERAVETLEGVGAARAKALRAAGIFTLWDLLNYFPRDYRQESAELAISALHGADIQTARGEVVAVNYVPSRPRPRFEATIDDGTGKCGIVWFHGAYLRKTIHPGITIRAKGKVRWYHNMPQMQNPKWEMVDAQTAPVTQGRFAAVYPATGNLTSDVVNAIVAANLEAGTAEIEEWFDGDLLKKRGVIGRAEAYRKIHQPKDYREAMQARRRLVYDELMLMQIGLGLNKRVREGRISAPVLRIDKLLDERIRGRFPFTMTNAQTNATWEIVRDLGSGRPMNRLLQGDVGSGKTIVALYAMLTAVANRMQAAILAPTEVLAEQHYLTLSNLLKDSAVRIELYTHRTKKVAKAEGRARRAAQLALIEGAPGERDARDRVSDLAEGKVHIAVGTQALIQEDIEFANLGLVVVDEQHRLGVKQRAVLKGKGLAPHYLVMTATPIPRTLALSYFADFDVSVIDELPPGRQPIKTVWMKQREINKAYALVKEAVAKGRQAYVVLPRIDDDGMDESKSVVKEFEKLSKGALAGLRLAILHGQMSTEEKQAVMTAFRDGATDVLVATTVIEVGIDVPNATVMVIDNAEQFGLSQLHQLRGRVGRGREASTCLLIADAASETVEARLGAMVRTGDGFEIAEMDLQLRGPGEFFGTRQHGLPEFRLADITKEMELLALAKEDAGEILAADPKLRQHAAMRRALSAEMGNELALAGVG